MNKLYIPILQSLLVLSIVAFVNPVMAACNSNVVSTAPDSRYVDHNNGTVTDLYTGLMWQQCSYGQTPVGSVCTGSVSDMAWDSALQHVGTVNTPGFAGHSDWRLPNVKELESLTDDACYSPAINGILFTSISGGYYWSSSPSAGVPGNAWSVDFSFGYSSHEPRTETNHVRLVRNVP